MAVGLTLRQERFVRELPTAKSQKEAALRAGYEPSCAEAAASRNTRKYKIALAVAEERAKVEAQAEMTRQQWIDQLQREATAGSFGEANAARISALNSIGKACGWLTDKVELRVDNTRLLAAMSKVAARYIKDPAEFKRFCLEVETACR